MDPVCLLCSYLSVEFLFPLLIDSFIQLVKFNDGSSFLLVMFFFSFSFCLCCGLIARLEYVKSVLWFLMQFGFCLSITQCNCQICNWQIQLTSLFLSTNSMIDMRNFRFSMLIFVKVFLFAVSWSQLQINSLIRLIGGTMFSYDETDSGGLTGNARFGNAGLLDVLYLPVN